MALSRHCSENHGTINKPPLHEAYTVTFVEQPSCHSLDICENKWYHLIDAQINIRKTILPHVKYLLRCKYVLSTMGVSKESISKFLIGNRFHVKLRILSPRQCKLVGTLVPGHCSQKLKLAIVECVHLIFLMQKSKLCHR